MFSKETQNQFLDLRKQSWNFPKKPNPIRKGYRSNSKTKGSWRLTFIGAPYESFHTLVCVTIQSGFTMAYLTGACLLYSKGQRRPYDPFPYRLSFIRKIKI